LAFCGNMPLEPSWYIMENLSDNKEYGFERAYEFEKYLTLSFRKKVLHKHN